jgi:hypothetical protein
MLVDVTIFAADGHPRCAAGQGPVLPGGAGAGSALAGSPPLGVVCARTTGHQGACCVARLRNRRALRDGRRPAAASHFTLNFSYLTCLNQISTYFTVWLPAESGARTLEDRRLYLPTLKNVLSWRSAAPMGLYG